VIIHQASLALRYLPCDGWTRQAVADLLGVPDPMRYVIPRYYDHRDPPARGDQTTDDRDPHPEAAYYAVYAIGVAPEEGDPRLAGHDVVDTRPPRRP